MTPRHVVLFSIDDLRFDAVGWQPDRRYWQALAIDGRMNTPTMDALARECVLFTRCVSNAGYTPLSHATLFTGCYARRHGVVNFHNTVCHPDAVTLSEHFSRRGWRTMLLTNPPRQTLFCEANQTLRHVDERFSDDEAFLAALRDAADERVFAVIHVCDVHDPLVRGGEPAGSPPAASGSLPPAAACDGPAFPRDWELFLRLVFNARPAPEPDSHDVLLPDGTRMSYANLQARSPGKSADEILAHVRRLLQAYLYTCEKFDRTRFKRLIDGLRGSGAWNQTALAVLSDHGESQFWAYPWRLAHGALTDETVIRVPLMMKLPGQRPRRIDHLAGLVDVTPTLLDVVGIDVASESLDGRSLLPTIHDNRPAGDEYWIEGWSHELTDEHPTVACRAIRRADGRKYVWNGDTIDWDRLDALPGGAFADYAARMSFGNPPSQWLRGRIAKLAAERGRVGALRELLRECRPRHLIFDNVDQDLTERQGVIVDERHPRWPEYQACQRRMADLTATPDFSVLRDGGLQTEALTAHLQALGYVS